MMQRLRAQTNFEVDDDLPPLVPMEESDIPSGPVQGEVDQTHEESNQGQAEASSSRNPGSGSSTPSRNLRQLRNRTVARSIMGNQRVKFNEVIDCVCQDQHYKERIQFEKEGTLFPPFEQREDVDYLSQERWELLLTLYVDASFSTGGGRSRTGMAMYLVNPIDGSESLVQWASRRQTSMATSAPEAEVSAMAEGFAASIFLFDSLKELKLVKGVGPSCILSMKTDSAVALKQLNTQSVAVRSRTAAQKLTYLRELVYQAPQVEPIYISGQSQRADGQTKTLSGQPLKEAQRHFNLVPHSELRIQVCYHPSFSPRLVSIREDRELGVVSEIVGSSSVRQVDCNIGKRQQSERNGGGGSRQEHGNTRSQMTPQETRQYDWYVKKYEKADMTRTPKAERERISMIIAALFPCHSHMPPERHERKVGKKKSLQGETPGESRDEIKARTAAY